MSITIDFFSLGLFFIPFDNLFFAPSRGWATIAPIIFFIYIFINYKALGAVLYKIKNLIFIILVLLIQQGVILSIHGVRFSSFIDSLETIVLGLSYYISLIIRYQIYKKDPINDGKILYRAYLISFIYGVIRFISMHYATFILPFFLYIEKRNYPRLAFTFTEPSFTSMHIIGVLWLYVYLIKDKTLANKMIFLGLCFLICETITLSSTKCIIDFFVFILLFLMKITLKNQKFFLRNLFFWGIGFILFFIIINKYPRVANLLNKGIYSDASGASRWFRIDASIKGFATNLTWTLFGWGLGNMIIPFRVGYYDALNNFSNSYINEILIFENVETINSVICLPVKIISEFGLISFILFFISIIQHSFRHKIDVFVIIMSFWLNLQFDSYAFYNLWLLIYIAKYYSPEKFGFSYFDYISPNNTSKKSLVII